MVIIRILFAGRAHVEGWWGRFRSNNGLLDITKLLQRTAEHDGDASIMERYYVFPPLRAWCFDWTCLPVSIVEGEAFWCPPSPKDGNDCNNN